MESKIVVSEQVSTLSSEYVGLLKSFIQFQCYGEILHSFIKNAQASIASTSSQMKLTCSFLFLLNGNVEIIQCIIEIVELIMKQSTEEIQTRLLLLFAAAFDCYIQKPFCLPDFVQFLAVVYVQLVE